MALISEEILSNFISVETLLNKTIKWSMCVQQDDILSYIVKSFTKNSQVQQFLKSKKISLFEREDGGFLSQQQLNELFDGCILYLQAKKLACDEANKFNQQKIKMLEIKRKSKQIVAQNFFKKKRVQQQIVEENLQRFQKKIQIPADEGYVESRQRKLFRQFGEQINKNLSNAQKVKQIIQYYSKMMNVINQQKFHEQNKVFISLLQTLKGLMDSTLSKINQVQIENKEQKKEQIKNYWSIGSIDSWNNIKGGGKIEQQNQNKKIILANQILQQVNQLIECKPFQKSFTNQQIAQACLFADRLLQQMDGKTTNLQKALARFRILKRNYQYNSQYQQYLSQISKPSFQISLSYSQILKHLKALVFAQSAHIQMSLQRNKIKTTNKFEMSSLQFLNEKIQITTSYIMLKIVSNKYMNSQESIPVLLNQKNNDSQSISKDLNKDENKKVQYFQQDSLQDEMNKFKDKIEDQVLSNPQNLNKIKQDIINKLQVGKRVFFLKQLYNQAFVACHNCLKDSQEEIKKLKEAALQAQEQEQVANDKQIVDTVSLIVNKAKQKLQDQKYINQLLGMTKQKRKILEAFCFICSIAMQKNAKQDDLFEKIVGDLSKWLEEKYPNQNKNDEMEGIGQERCKKILKELKATVSPEKNSFQEMFISKLNDLLFGASGVKKMKRFIAKQNQIKQQNQTLQKYIHQIQKDHKKTFLKAKKVVDDGKEIQKKIYIQKDNIERNATKKQTGKDISQTEITKLTNQNLMLQTQVTNSKLQIQQNLSLIKSLQDKIEIISTQKKYVEAENQNLQVNNFALKLSLKQSNLNSKILQQQIIEKKQQEQKIVNQSKIKENENQQKLKKLLLEKQQIQRKTKEQREALYKALQLQTQINAKDKIQLTKSKLQSQNKLKTDTQIQLQKQSLKQVEAIKRSMLRQSDMEIKYQSKVRQLQNKEIAFNIKMNEINQAYQFQMNVKDQQIELLRIKMATQKADPDARNEVRALHSELLQSKIKLQLQKQKNTNLQNEIQNNRSMIRELKNSHISSSNISNYPQNPYTSNVHLSRNMQIQVDNEANNNFVFQFKDMVDKLLKQNYINDPNGWLKNANQFQSLQALGQIIISLLEEKQQLINSQQVLDKKKNINQVDLQMDNKKLQTSKQQLDKVQDHFSQQKTKQSNKKYSNPKTMFQPQTIQEAERKVVNDRAQYISREMSHMLSNIFHINQRELQQKILTTFKNPTTQNIMNLKHFLPKRFQLQLQFIQKYAAQTLKMPNMQTAQTPEAAMRMIIKKYQNNDEIEKMVKQQNYQKIAQKLLSVENINFQSFKEADEIAQKLHVNFKSSSVKDYIYLRYIVQLQNKKRTFSNQQPSKIPQNQPLGNLFTGGLKQKLQKGQPLFEKKNEGPLFPNNNNNNNSQLFSSNVSWSNYLNADEDQIKKIQSIRKELLSEDNMTKKDIIARLSQLKRKNLQVTTSKQQPNKKKIMRHLLELQIAVFQKKKIFLDIMEKGGINMNANKSEIKEVLSSLNSVKIGQKISNYYFQKVYQQMKTKSEAIVTQFNTQIGLVQKKLQAIDSKSGGKYTDLNKILLRILHGTMDIVGGVPDQMKLFQSQVYSQKAANQSKIRQTVKSLQIQIVEIQDKIKNPFILQETRAY